MLFVEPVGAGEEVEMLGDSVSLSQRSGTCGQCPRRPRRHLPSVRTEQAHNNLHQGALPGAVLTDEANQLTRLDVEVSPAEDSDATPPRPDAAVVVLCQSSDFERRG
jgi:hypothetical protein